MYKLATMFFVMTIPVSALAGTQLNGEQIKQLVSGNTVLAHNIDQGTDYKNYYSPDGTMISRNESNGQIYKDKRWRVSDSGDICSQSAGKKESCGQVVDNGDGTYNRLDNGSPRGVWKKVYPGNTIAE